MKNVHHTALKSARLVLNVTRNPGVGQVSKIIIENEGKIPTLPTTLPEKKTDKEAVAIRTIEDDEDYREDYLDWQADNEVQSIMLGNSEDNPEFIEFSQTSSTERDNVDENVFSSQIGSQDPATFFVLFQPTHRPRICLAKVRVRRV